LTTTSDYEDNDNDGAMDDYDDSNNDVIDADKVMGDNNDDNVSDDCDGQQR
jgi:hypothetical protein